MVSQNISHTVLEKRRCSSEPKWHASICKMTILSDICQVWASVAGNRYIVETCFYVYLCEACILVKEIQGALHVRDGHYTLTNMSNQGFKVDIYTKVQVSLPL